MDMTYYTSTNEEQAIEYATLARSARLYVPGWRLFGILKAIQISDVLTARDPTVTIGIDKLTNEVVGVAVRYKCHVSAINFTMQVFTKPVCRGQGIGTNLVMLNGGMCGSVGGCGIKGSMEFWKHCRELSGIVFLEDEPDTVAA